MMFLTTTNQQLFASSGGMPPHLKNYASIWSQKTRQLKFRYSQIISSFLRTLEARPRHYPPQWCNDGDAWRTIVHAAAFFAHLVAQNDEQEWRP